jgi:hypothetical protein
MGDIVDAKYEAMPAGLDDERPLRRRHRPGDDATVAEHPPQR